MYQLAPEVRSIDRTRLFIESCTSMIPSNENLGLVQTLASLIRGAVATSDVAPLRDYVAAAAGTDQLDDAMAAAGQAVVDEHDDLPFAKLHDLIRRVAQIERDALGIVSRSRDTLRTVYAG